MSVFISIFIKDNINIINIIEVYFSIILLKCGINFLSLRAFFVNEISFISDLGLVSNEIFSTTRYVDHSSPEESTDNKKKIFKIESLMQIFYMNIPYKKKMHNCKSNWKKKNSFCCGKLWRPPLDCKTKSKLFRDKNITEKGNTHTKIRKNTAISFPKVL